MDNDIEQFLMVFIPVVVGILALTMIVKRKKRVSGSEKKFRNSSLKNVRKSAEAKSAGQTAPAQMVCPECGKKYPLTQVYCDECGSLLKET